MTSQKSKSPLLKTSLANRVLEENPDLTTRQAIIRAAGTRLRPIFMTGLAVVLGLTPMAITGGANIPLARAVVGGVIAAVTFVPFVVPPLFVILKRHTPAAA